MGALANYLSHLESSFFLTLQMSSLVESQTEKLQSSCFSPGFCQGLLIRAQGWQRGRDINSLAKYLCNLEKVPSMAFVSSSLKCQDSSLLKGLIRNTHSQCPSRTWWWSRNLFITGYSGDSYEHPGMPTTLLHDPWSSFWPHILRVDGMWGKISQN